MDDEKIEGKTGALKDTLKKEFGIEDITIVQSYEDALQKIKIDTKNKYNIIIADYRLQDKNGEYKEPQGYHFVKEITENNDRFQEIFVLSGLDQNFLDKTMEEI